MYLKACFLLLQALIFCSQNLFQLADALAPLDNIRDVNDNEFPFLASIEYKNVRSKVVHNFCTGALVGKKFILTADHCFKDKDTDVPEKPEDIQVRINAADLNKPSKVYNVKGWISYDQWAAKNEKKLNGNDIGIMMLTEEVSGVQSAELSDAKKTALNKQRAIVIGYGGTDETGPSQTLQLGYVKVLEQKECIEKYRKLTGTRAVPSNDHFCTQGKPDVILQDGDSGSPLLDINKKIIGVSSYTTDGSPAKAVNMHLTLEHHKEFIEDVTKNPQKYF